MDMWTRIFPGISIKIAGHERLKHPAVSSGRQMGKCFGWEPLQREKSSTVKNNKNKSFVNVPEGKGSNKAL